MFGKLLAVKGKCLKAFCCWFYYRISNYVMQYDITQSAIHMQFINLFKIIQLNTLHFEHKMIIL